MIRGIRSGIGAGDSDGSELRDVCDDALRARVTDTALVLGRNSLDLIDHKNIERYLFAYQSKP